MRPPDRVARRPGALLAVSAAWATGCLALAGNFDVVGTGGPDAGLDEDAGQHPVSPVEAAVDPALSPPDARSQADAPDPAAVLAEAAAAAPSVCGSGQFQCEKVAGADLQVCNPDRRRLGDHHDVRPPPRTADAGHGVCTPPPCVAGQVQCSGSNLQTCAGPDTGWTTMTTCATSALCNADSGACTAPACSPNQHRCNGAELDVCNTDLTDWVAATTCINASHCDADGGQCAAAACAPGAYLCSGKNLQSCDTNRDGYKTMQTCATPDLCDAASGQCDAPACKAGDTQCKGADLQQCNAGQTGWTTVQTCLLAALCDAKHNLCILPGLGPH